MVFIVSNSQGISESHDALIECFVLNNIVGFADRSQGILLLFGNNSNTPIEQALWVYCSFHCPSKEGVTKVS